jgi:hypothetical protein
VRLDQKQRLSQLSSGFVFLAHALAEVAMAQKTPFVGRFDRNRGGIPA